MRINRDALNQCLDAPVLRRSLGVSVIIGSLLVAINQGDVILAGESPAIWKVALTYAVPFCVASYGAYSACVARQRADAEAERND